MGTDATPFSEQFGGQVAGCTPLGGALEKMDVKQRIEQLLAKIPFMAAPLHVWDFTSPSW